MVGRTTTPTATAVACWKCGKPTTPKGNIWFCECGSGWMRGDGYLIRTNRPPPGVVERLIVQLAVLKARRPAGEEVR